MKEQEATTRIQQEKLTRVNWYDENNLRENEVGIRKILDSWEVYMTSERGEIVDSSRYQFSNNEDAYDALIERARFLKKIFN